MEPCGTPVLIFFQPLQVQHTLFLGGLYVEWLIC